VGVGVAFALELSSTAGVARIADTSRQRAERALLPSEDSYLRRSNKMATTNVTGYCMKCKAQREVKDPKQITMKNGRPATEGSCQVCGTKIFKIGAAK
jgi:hypothetical protein